SLHKMPLPRWQFCRVGYSKSKQKNFPRFGSTCARGVTPFTNFCSVSVLVLESDRLTTLYRFHHSTLHDHRSSAETNHLDIRALKCHNFYQFTVFNSVNPL